MYCVRRVEKQIRKKEIREEKKKERKQSKKRCDGRKRKQWKLENILMKERKIDWEERKKKN